MRDVRQMLEMVEEILNEGRHVTKWEHSFLESLSDRLTQGRGLSEREEEIVVKVHERTCHG